MGTVKCPSCCSLCSLKPETRVLINKQDCQRLETQLCQESACAANMGTCIQPAEQTRKPHLGTQESDSLKGDTGFRNQSAGCGAKRQGEASSEDASQKNLAA